MPRFRKRRRTRKPRRRSYRKRRSRFRTSRRRRTRRIRAVNPRTRLVKLKYAEYFTLDVGVGGLGLGHAFRLNSLYDPNFSGTGHQPMGYDELATYYKNTMVIGAKVTLRMYNTGNGSSDYAVASLWPRFGQDTPSNPNIASAQLLWETPGVTTKLLNLIGTGKDLQTMSRKFSIKKWAQVPNMMDNKILFAEDFTASLPNVNALMLWVGVNPFVPSQDIDVVRFFIQIDYIAIAFNPLDKYPQS